MQFRSFVSLQVDNGQGSHAELLGVARHEPPNSGECQCQYETYTRYNLKQEGVSPDLPQLFLQHINALSVSHYLPLPQASTVTRSSMSNAGLAVKRSMILTDATLSTVKGMEMPTMINGDGR